MIYTKIQKEACIACGLCQIKAPSLFNYDENGIAYTIQDHNKGISPIPQEQAAKFKEAYFACPTHAILKSDQPFHS